MRIVKDHGKKSVPAVSYVRLERITGRIRLIIRSVLIVERKRGLIL